VGLTGTVNHFSRERGIGRQGKKRGNSWSSRADHPNFREGQPGKLLVVVLVVIGGGVGLLLLALLLCGLSGVLSEGKGNGPEDDAKTDRECEQLFHACNSPFNLKCEMPIAASRHDWTVSQLGKLLVVLLIGSRVGLLLALLAHFLRGVSGVLREGNGAEDDAKAKSKYEKLFHAWCFSLRYGDDLPSAES
jgi:hypothetical protein